MDALLHPSPFKLRNRRKDAHHKPSPPRLPFVEQQHKMPEVAAEPIEFPADLSVQLVSAHILGESVQSWAAVPR